MVRNSISEWRNTGSIHSEETFIEARKAVARARFIHHSHPLYMDLSGQILEWGASVGYLTKGHLNAAQHAYKNATKMRPTWPVTWGSLAMVKWRKQEFDDELLSYLNKADRFGPYTPEIHTLFTQLGLTLYSVNHPFFNSIREQVKERVVLGLKSHTTSSDLLQFLRDTNNLKTACRWVKEEEYLYNSLLRCDMNG